MVYTGRETINGSAVLLSELPLPHYRGQACVYDFCVIRPHIPRVLETPRPPIKRKIGKRRNTIVTGPQSKVNAMTQPTQPTQTSHRSSHLIVIFLTFRKRRTVDKKDGRNTISCGTKLKAGVLVENISGLSRRTITCAGQSSLCPPRGYNSGAIHLHIPRAPNTMSRPPISSIKKSWTIHSRVESWNYCMNLCFSYAELGRWISHLHFVQSSFGCLHYVRLLSP